MSIASRTCRSLAAPLLLLLAGVTLPAWSGQLYKTVDKDGNVTFSQFPPQPQEQADVKVNAVEVKEDNGTIMSVVNGRATCGSIQLPDIGRNDPVKLLELQQQRKEWQDTLESGSDVSEVAMRLYLNRYFTTSPSADVHQQKRDLRCAIQWVDSLKGDMQNARESLTAQSRQLDQQLERLKAERERACGSEPEYDATQPGTSELWQRWSDCHEARSSEIYELQDKADSIRVEE